MSDRIDIEGLAREITEIARTTTDEEAGRRLMELVHRMLTNAGLDHDLDDDFGGGEEPPTGRVSALMAIDD